MIDIHTGTLSSDIAPLPSKQERVQFCERLKQALDLQGYPSGPTEVCREFNARYGDRPVSVHGVRKWLIGDAMPTQQKLTALARWLCVTPQWLRYGELDQIGGALADGATRSLHPGLAGMLHDFHLLSEGDQKVVRELIRTLLKLERTAA